MVIELGLIRFSAVLVAGGSRSCAVRRSGEPVDPAAALAVNASGKSCPVVIHTGVPTLAEAAKSAAVAYLSAPWTRGLALLCASVRKSRIRFQVALSRTPVRGTPPFR